MLKLQLADSTENRVYGRIADAMCDAVASGKVVAGEKLPTKSALAMELGVHRMTVSRAYEDLQRRRIITQKRGSGTYVATDAVRWLQHSGKRRIATVAWVLGEKSLSECRRETLFVVTDILDGMREVLGEGGTRFTFLESFTRACAADLTEEDAFVVTVPRECDATFMHDTLRRGVPIVYVATDSTSAMIPHVNYDRHQSATLACRHLVECGYKRIGFIGVKSYPSVAVSPKFAAFGSVLHEHGIDVRARHVRDVDISPGTAYAAASDLIQSGDLPEAFFVDTDYKAMEVIGALHKAGIRVPEEIGIVAYDDIPEAAAFEPPLTTVRVPRREIGRRAAQLLLDWPDSGPVPEGVMLTSELIVRMSTRRQS